MVAPHLCQSWGPPLQVCETVDYDPQSGPYLIGLTGAMATGKSSVMARLVKLGAYPIDCDKVRQLILCKILILAG